MTNEKKHSLSVTFVYSGGHFVHKAFAGSVGAVPHRYNQTSIERTAFTAPILDIINSFRIPRSDVLLCESVEALPACVYMKKRTGCRIINILADPVFLDLENKNLLFKKYILWALRNVDGFIAVSQMQKSILARYIKKPVKVVVPFLNAERVRDCRPALRQKSLVFVGALQNYKGIGMLIEVFRRLKEKDPGFKLYVIGDGPLLDDLKKEKLQGLFVEGFQADIRKYFKKCSIYLHPAKLEPWGISIAEAMNAGLVPLVSDRTGSKELVERVSRELVLADDPDEYVKKIIDLSKDPVKMGRYSKKAREVSSRLTKESQEAEFELAFYQLLNDRC